MFGTVVAVLLALPGFAENPRLSEVAPNAAGKPVAVYCAATVCGKAPKPDFQTQLASAVMVLAGKSTAVKCATNEEWAGGPIPTRDGGFYRAAEQRIYLAPRTCQALRALSQLRTDTPSAYGALRALAHESQHAAGISDEAAAECYAIQRVAEAAILFGAPRKVALRLQRYWVRYFNFPPGYWSPECRDGGALDLNPDDPRWP